MPNLDDIDLQPSTSHDFDLRTPGAEPPADEGRRPSIWVALAILVAPISATRMASATQMLGRRPSSAGGSAPGVRRSKSCEVDG